MQQKITNLLPPALHNSSCLNTKGIFDDMGFGDVLQALIVFMVTVGVLVANILLIVVINTRRYSKYIHSQPRYLLTSLACNDLAMGLFVTPFAVVPSIRRCWPYGELACQIQALLRGAISQQSAVILVCMAMDRYLCMLHPARYHKHSSKRHNVIFCPFSYHFSQTTKNPLGEDSVEDALDQYTHAQSHTSSFTFSGILWSNLSGCTAKTTSSRLHPSEPTTSVYGCVAIISMTWIMSVSLFSVLVLPRGGYYFNPTGMVACEPFYAQASIRILAACGFYFPTTMILMYCYGSAFHVNKLRLRKAGCNTIASPDDYGGASIEKLVTQERRLSTNASRTMAAMSLGFIVLVTPWTIQEVVAACTGSRAPAGLDFLATWLALSNSFWNPFLYWLLNNQFRRISRELLFGRVFCRKKDPHKHQQQQQHHHTCSNSSSGQLAHAQGCDLEGLSEKYWGEILERTLSSSSLHALQRAYTTPHMGRCNGIQEMRVLDTAVPDL